jgi:hypothetical protein
MPAWWKRKGRTARTKAPDPPSHGGSVPAAAAAVGRDRSKNKKASSFDEALIAREGRGKQLQQLPAVGHPLPRPASLPSPLPSTSASGSTSSGGSSSLGSSAASDEPPDLGFYRYVRAEADTY